MQIEQYSVIKVNKVVWNLIDPVNNIVERLGIKARLIFKTKNLGRMVHTNKVNGRIMSSPFMMG